MVGRKWGTRLKAYGLLHIRKCISPNEVQTPVPLPPHTHTSTDSSLDGSDGRHPTHEFPRTRCSTISPLDMQNYIQPAICNSSTPPTGAKSSSAGPSAGLVPQMRHFTLSATQRLQNGVVMCGRPGNGWLPATAQVLHQSAGPGWPQQLHEILSFGVSGRELRIVTIAYAVNAARADFSFRRCASEGMANE